MAKGLTIGHEPVGVIEKLGSAVQGFAEGRRVIAGAITPSRHSAACLCGCSSQDGGFHGHGCAEQDVTAQTPIMTSFLTCLSFSRAPFSCHTPALGPRPVRLKWCRCWRRRVPRRCAAPMRMVCAAHHTTTSPETRPATGRA
ncbi:MAG TPA: alcohol dehydrogenase catalytic domain-containing protein [Rhodopila sp.]